MRGCFNRQAARKRNRPSPSPLPRGERVLFALISALVLSPQAHAQDARLQAFEAQLEANPSATAVLQAWCDAHGPAPGTRIVARPGTGAPKPPSPEAATALHIGPDTQVRYRRVELACGDKVLSRADNWYLPAELTPAMNRALDTTQTPFGAVVAPLGFTRRNLETTFLQPSAQGVLRHSAVLSTAAGQPFSFVVETYSEAIEGY